jgi:pyruvate ferredoxin oxidoreductase alpha subunit
MSNDSTITWRIAGGSGDGINSTSKNFAKGLMRNGYNIFTHRHYPSRIRGGHTFAEVRISDDEVTSRGDEYNFLLSLGDSFARSEQENAYYGNESTKPVTENLHDLTDGGVIVYDSGVISKDDLPDDFDEKVEKHSWNVFGVDLREIATNYGRPIMRNTGGVGVTCSILGIDPEVIYTILEDSMDESILKSNKEVFKEAYEVASDFEGDIELDQSEYHKEEKALMSGDGTVL